MRRSLVKDRRTDNEVLVVGFRITLFCGTLKMKGDDYQLIISIKKSFFENFKNNILGYCRLYGALISGLIVVKLLFLNSSS